MDTYRAFLAIIISFVILLGYQYLFVGFDKPAVVEETTETITQQQGDQQVSNASVPQILATQASTPQVVAPVYDRQPKNIEIETDLYSALISEDGGTIRSFVLKKHTETNEVDSAGMELVKTNASQGYPLDFSWGSVAGPRLLYTSEVETLNLTGSNQQATLRLVSSGANGVELERIYTFYYDTYLIDMSVRVTNSSGAPLQGMAQLQQVNTSFAGVSSPANRFLFGGPAGYINGELQEIKAGDFEEGPKTLQGAIDWAGFEGNYFLCGIVPLDGAAKSFTMQGNQDLVRTQLSGDLDTLQPGVAKEYTYHVYYGPKKLKMLQGVGYNLDQAVNFGWFDILAQPALWLLNFFYGFFGNYGIAIILVTVLFKLVFWPISQKGMKSMKNMQKLQPKMAKIREKYKSDPTKMNQEVMALYKTYKVNPLGGCLPMVLQIPVFFALYKVLLQSIELRHAPFMLWITDLSAPDRLWLGFDIPYVGGLPVLTLLMGASMFLQQKMTPTTADPTQAKIMMFLPVVFTFMFINFASGLVLYWFVNNLLSILQQVLINRERKPVVTT